MAELSKEVLAALQAKADEALKHGGK